MCVRLWEDAVDATTLLERRSRKRLSNTPPSAESTRSTNARRARRAVENGQYKKAIQSLSSAGFAPPSEDVLDEMLAKHPQSGASPFSFDEAPPPVQVAIVDVVNALRSFPSGTAPGPSCLRANHVKEAVFCSSPDSAESALEGLVGVVNLLCAGRAPPAILPYLCGATLLACNKKNGGLRPIAVGEVLRRLTSKCVSRAVHTDAIEVLSPLQVGVGIPVGCESIVHSVVSLQEDFSIPPESRCALLVDFSNAFNSVNRACMFQEVRSRIPSMAAWVESCYGSQPLLYFGDHKLFSCCGVQQGDPLGPLCFALTLHPVVEQIKREVPELLINAWYLDDGTLCGSLSDIGSALAIIESVGPSRGLILNKSKSLLFVPADASPSNHAVPPEVQFAVMVSSSWALRLAHHPTVSLLS